MKVKSLNEVINALRPGDMRIEFWKQIRELVRDRAYGEIATRINNHSDDCDFDEQCMVVVRAIASMEFDLSREVHLPTASQGEGNGFDDIDTTHHD